MAQATNEAAGRSAAQVVASWPADKRRQWYAKLSETERIALAWSWRFVGRPAQQPPDWGWFCWFICAGRGFGKTRTAVQWVQDKANQGGVGGRIALAGRTEDDLVKTMLEGESGLIAMAPPWNRPRFTRGQVEWPSGVIGYCYSGHQPEKFRGPQHHHAWCDEIAAWRYPEECWAQLKLGMRLGDKPQVVVTTTPKPRKIIRMLAALHGKTVHMTKGTTYDNLDNLSASFKEDVLAEYEGTRLGLQELRGVILDDNPNALWRRAMFEEEGFRLTSAPVMPFVAVGVDPSVTSGEQSDQAGIISAGADANGDLYVLADDTLRDTPFRWATQAVTAYHREKADRIVYEGNQGGEMTESIIHVVDSTVATMRVHATRSKIIRAEPIAAMYEKHRVHHVGRFDLLEDELCNYDPRDTNAASPNRLDALVHVLTHLAERTKKRRRGVDLSGLMQPKGSR